MPEKETQFNVSLLSIMKSGQQFTQTQPTHLVPPSLFSLSVEVARKRLVYMVYMVYMVYIGTKTLSLGKCNFKRDNLKKDVQLYYDIIIKGTIHPNTVLQVYQCNVLMLKLIALSCLPLFIDRLISFNLSVEL